MASEAQRKAIAKFQATKARVNIWMSPEGKEKLTEYAKTTPEKSMQKYLLRLIRDESGIDCETENNDNNGADNQNGEKDNDNGGN